MTVIFQRYARLRIGCSRYGSSAMNSIIFRQIREVGFKDSYNGFCRIKFIPPRNICVIIRRTPKKDP